MTLKAMESLIDQMEIETTTIHEEQRRMNKELQKSKEESNFLFQQLMRSIQDQFAELRQSMGDKPYKWTQNLSPPQEDISNIMSTPHSLVVNKASINPNKKLVSGLTTTTNTP